MAGVMKCAILVALAMAVACVPVAWADGRANTRVTIDSAFINPGETLFAGDIFSPRKACKNDRRVLIFRVRPGADEKIGATRSYKGSAQPGYYWTHSEPGLASGRQLLLEGQAQHEMPRRPFRRHRVGSLAGGPSAPDALWRRSSQGLTGGAAKRRPFSSSQSAV